MKIEGMEFIDWLHKIRKASEEERIRKSINGVEWLKQISKEVETILWQISKQKNIGVMHKN